MRPEGGPGCEPGTALSRSWPEPLGLLQPPDAAAAVATGIARVLAGGSTAYTLVRHDGQVHTAAAFAQDNPGLAARLSLAPPRWAGFDAPAIMGIVNVTPDSFSDGGDRLDTKAAIAAGHRMLEDGADILDIGGESTRPGATPLSPAEEQARILPVIAALARAGATVSVDTRNAETMARALDAGARIVNDVTALAHDPAAAGLVAARRCPVVLMHMRGTPATMAGLARYTDVAAEVAQELALRIAAAEAAGVARSDILLDPGFGFAKTAAHNVELLQRLPLLLNLGRPLLAGLSRKATIGTLAHQPDPRLRDPGSIAAALFALDRGARVLRVHDVAGTRQALFVWQGLRG